MRRYIGVAAGVGLVTAALSVTGGLPALAQGAMKPLAALIVNDVSSPVPVSGTVTIVNSNASPLVVRPVAEIPYQRSKFFNQDATTCTNFVCEVTFDAVPAGYRLVVTYVSARYAMSAPQATATVTVGTVGTVAGTSILLPAPVPIGGSNWVTGSPVTFYIEAGETPRLGLGGVFVSGTTNTAHASIVGRLEPVP